MRREAAIFARVLLDAFRGIEFVNTANLVLDLNRLATPVHVDVDGIPTRRLRVAYGMPTLHSCGSWSRVARLEQRVFESWVRYK